MSVIGVQPTGFVRKSLPDILQDIEQANVTEFGPGVIQTSQSPLGQLNGLAADIVSEIWELAEDIYASYDPDQAEGARLDILGRLRLVYRPAGSDDTIHRQAITNEGVARITLTDITTAIRGVDGVMWAQTYVNETGRDDENDMPPNSIALAVLGGLDDNIAALINRYLPPGVTSYGNVRVTAIEDGFCRTMRIVRPVEVEIELTIRIIRRADRRGCPAPSATAIGTMLANYLTVPQTRPWNGQDINAYNLRQFLEGIEGVQFDSFIGKRVSTEEEYNVAVPIAFFEIAKITTVTVEVINT